MISHFNRYTEA